MATNTTKKITTGVLEAELTKAKEAFNSEKLVEVSIPKSLKSSIGETLPIRINGVGIVLPVDGTKHKVPESFASHLMDYLNNLKH